MRFKQSHATIQEILDNAQSGGGGDTSESPIKIGTFTGNTSSSGEIHLSKENAPDDFGDGSFVGVIVTNVGLTTGYSVVRMISKFSNADNVTLLVYGDPSKGLTSNNIQKSQSVTIRYCYIPKA